MNFEVILLAMLAVFLAGFSMGWSALQLALDYFGDPRCHKERKAGEGQAKNRDPDR